MRHWAGVGLILVAAVGLLLRGGALERRPLHNDEAINAVKLRALWERGEYRYDPHEYHGPALYFLTLPFLAAASSFEPDQPAIAAMRSMSVACGIALILGLWLLRGALGPGPMIAAAAWTAVSTAMVYYSRYYIHEMLLVLVTFVTFAACWRYACHPRAAWALVAGAGVGLMYATKETFVFALAAGAAAWAVNVAVSGGITEEPGDGARAREGRARRAWIRLRTAVRAVRPRDAALAAAACLIVFVAFFSSFFTNAAGPLDAVRTYFIWAERAGGESPHVHPWDFYLRRLAWFHERGAPVWTEGAVLIMAAAGAIAGSATSRGPRERRWLVRFITGYTVLLAAVYSVIPYKTPWCLLGFHHGMLILAGVGTWWLVTLFRPVWFRAMAACLSFAGMVHLGIQAARANGDWAADFRNPYVYGHTSADIVNLLEQVRGMAAFHPDGKAMPMQVIVRGDAYWPLPWYWRDFARIGWRSAVPEDLHPAVIVISENSLGLNLEERSDGAWRFVGMFEIRPRVFLELYVETRFWADYLASRG